MNFEPKRTAQEAQQDCPVCGGFKMSHELECQDCIDQRRVISERNRQRARDRKIGPLWPRE